MQARWYHYLYAFIVGGIVVNCLPHLINGISGRPFPSPFSDPPGIGLSSPLLNILWALINVAVAFAFFYFGKLSQRDKSIGIGYFVGAVAMAFYLAHYFGALNLT